MKSFSVLLGLIALTACSSAAAPAGDGQGGGAPAENGTIAPPAAGTPGAPGATTPAPTAPPAARAGIDSFAGSQIFMPPQTPAPGIVMLHGSEGGSEAFIKTFAAEVAKQGFVVVTLCWFGCTGKPATINRIPLESVVDIGEWLKGAPEVANGRVGLFGWSRGAEMSLLLTSLLGDTNLFRAVAVHAPSDTVVSGFDPAKENTPPDFGGILEADPAIGQQIPAPSWTWKGQPLFGEPKADFSTPGPRILVEKYPGPVYVSQGERDEIWEVARGKRVVLTRNANPNLFTQWHFFAGEGHVLQQPANIATQHQEIVTFFTKNLGP